MHITYQQETKIFHLYNESISYIMTVLPNGHLGQLYFGKRVSEGKDYSYLLEMRSRPMAACVFEDSKLFSLEHIKQEYGVYGTTDYRQPAVEILQENGSRIVDFRFKDYSIVQGKPKLEGLPATYTETPDEAMTLTIYLEDEVTGVCLELLYTIFELGALARSARIINRGKSEVHLLSAMSLCLDLPDCNYDWVQLSGAWARERHVKVRKLEPGITSVGSMRGHFTTCAMMRGGWRFPLRI